MFYCLFPKHKKKQVTVPTYPATNLGKSGNALTGPSPWRRNRTSIMNLTCKNLFMTDTTNCWSDSTRSQCFYFNSINWFSRDKFILHDLLAVLKAASFTFSSNNRCLNFSGDRNIVHWIHWLTVGHLREHILNGLQCFHPCHSFCSLCSN